VHVPGVLLLFSAPCHLASSGDYSLIQKNIIHGKYGSKTTKSELETKKRGMFLEAYAIQLQGEKNRALSISSHKLYLLSMYVCPFLSLLSKNNVL
jgi:hypothetical protein